MTKLAKRLDTHFAVCAAAGATAMIGGAEKAQAAVVYSGLVNITIPNTFAGVYINMVTGQTSSGGFAGQDFNPYFAGANMWMGGDGFNKAVTTDGTSVANLAAGTLIGPGSLYAASAFPTMGNFAPGVTGYMGLKFMNEGTNTINYGWIRITRGNGGDGTVVDWAYENTGQAIAAGDGVPAPGALATLALGALGARRRRRAA